MMPDASDSSNDESVLILAQVDEAFLNLAQGIIMTQDASPTSRHPISLDLRLLGRLTAS